MKKICCLLALIMVCTGTLCAGSFGAVEWMLGSGYVVYGQQSTKDRLKKLDDPGQLVLCTGAAYKYKLAQPVYLSVGVDTTFDFHWSNGNYVYLFDYTGLLGIQVYPGVAGLLVGVDYALGRRTDFFDVGDGSSSKSSNWGNGFKFSVTYEFFYHEEDFISPIVGISWRRMPRGNGADNILSVFCKLTIK